MKKMFAGGYTQPQYEAEKNEVVDGGLPAAFAGGSITPNSSTSGKINGNTHEQGGVQMAGGERVFSDRIKINPDFLGDLVMNKKTQTAAQLADKLTKKIGELEKKSKSSDRFAQETAKQMLPRYQEKLDALYNKQEELKQNAYNKELTALQTKFGLGGDIAAGLVGVAGGALGTVPFVGNIAQQGLYSLHDKLDNNLTDQEKSIRGFGQAAGSIGAGIATGNPMTAIQGGLNGIQTGYMYGQSPNPMGYAYGGKLPKYDDGGPIIPNSGETWESFLARASAAGIPENDTWDPVNQVMIPGALNMYNDPTARMAEQYNSSQSSINPSTTKGNDLYKPVQSPMYKDFSTNGTPNPDGSFTKAGVAYPTQSEYTDPVIGNKNPDPGLGDQEVPMGWQDYLYKGAAYSPTIYNAIRGMQKPQTLNHEDFQNPYEQSALGLMANRRYNIDPQLQANRSTLNNMQNNLKNYAGGNAATYLSNMGQLQTNTDKMNEAAYATKQNMDNQYKAEEAAMMGNLGANRAQTKFNIQNINDQNKAARDNYLGKAFEGLSGIAQNEKYMSNLAARDKERIAALNYMFPDYGYNVNNKGYFTGFNYKG